jgi:hypothetical protein
MHIYTCHAISVIHSKQSSVFATTKEKHPGARFSRSHDPALWKNTSLGVVCSCNMRRKHIPEMEGNGRGHLSQPGHGCSLSESVALQLSPHLPFPQKGFQGGLQGVNLSLPLYPPGACPALGAVLPPVPLFLFLEEIKIRPCKICTHHCKSVPTFPLKSLSSGMLR